MKTKEMKAIEWNEAKELEGMIESAASQKQALVIDPKEGVTGVMPSGLISANQNLSGSSRFGKHYSGA